MKNALKEILEITHYYDLESMKKKAKIAALNHSMESIREKCLDGLKENRHKELEMLAEIQAWIPLLSEWRSEKYGEFTIDRIGTSDSFEPCVFVGFNSTNAESPLYGWDFYYSNYKQKLIDFTESFKRLERGI